MKVTIPDFALVLLIGPTGAGKTQFARRHFSRDAGDLFRPLPRPRGR